MMMRTPPISPPPPVLPGDRVGVAALSGPVDPLRLESGLGALRRYGFDPVVAANVSAPPHLFFAGTDDERLQAFHELAADPSLKAIFFARGGYGLTRILERIDWSLLARYPRAYIGYSDLTPFLDEVVKRLGIAAFHGPMVAADLASGLSAEEEASLLMALAGRFPQTMPLTGWLRRGDAVGPLTGGCLSMLAATLGTPYAPRLDGKILVLEDVHEPPYRLDRMLTQLRGSGAFDQLAGLVLGHFSDPAAGQEAAAAEDEDGDEVEESWPRLLEEVLGGFDWPIAYGLPCGHFPPNLTVPLGLQGRLSRRHEHLSIGPRSARDARIHHR